MLKDVVRDVCAGMSIRTTCSRVELVLTGLNWLKSVRLDPYYKLDARASGLGSIEGSSVRYLVLQNSLVASAVTNSQINFERDLTILANA